jgi:hypothetical protein
MATIDKDDTDQNPLEAFLSGSPINRDELGDPPLANTKDPLLDRERIHLHPVDEIDESDNATESE